MKEITLPSGKIATYIGGNGQTIVNAQMKAKNNEQVTFALIAELIQIDGHPIVFEDLLEMEFDDVFVLHTAMMGKFHPLQQMALSIFPILQVGN